MESCLLISCDWGTSRVRLRLLDGEAHPRVVAECSSDRGILAFPPRDEAAFRKCLVGEIDRLFAAAGRAPEPAPVYLSGMITSSLGWVELPYAPVPFPLDGSGAIVHTLALPRPYGTHRLVFISGLRTEDDVLRGEETELIGLMSVEGFARHAAACVVLLPGTHSKVVEVEGGAVTGFRTYMTGELFQVLRQSSILRHSVDPELEPEPAETGGEMFGQGVRRASERGLAVSLFTVRTNALLSGVSREQNTYYLSGLLIGGEVASLLAQSAAGRPIVLGGTPRLQAFYRHAFELLGAGGRVAPVPEEISARAAALGHWRLRRSSAERLGEPIGAGCSGEG